MATYAERLQQLGEVVVTCTHLEEHARMIVSCYLSGLIPNRLPFETLFYRSGVRDMRSRLDEISRWHIEHPPWLDEADGWMKRAHVAVQQRDEIVHREPFEWTRIDVLSGERTSGQGWTRSRFSNQELWDDVRLQELLVKLAQLDREGIDLCHRAGRWKWTVLEESLRSLGWVKVGPADEGDMTL